MPQSFVECFENTAGTVNVYHCFVIFYEAMISNVSTGCFVDQQHF